MHPLLHILYVAAPATVVFSTSAACPVPKDSGSSVAVRPPPAAFGVVWGTLLVLLGVAWAGAVSPAWRDWRVHLPTTCCYGLLVGLLAAWVGVYACEGRRRDAFLLICAALGSTLVCMQVSPVLSRVALSPLAAWLVAALFLGGLEAQTLQDLRPPARPPL